MTSCGNNFNCFAENQMTKFSARNVGDFSEAAGEREIAPKCGSLPRDAGDLVGLENPTVEPNMKWIGRPLAEIWPFEISQM